MKKILTINFLIFAYILLPIHNSHAQSLEQQMQIQSEKNAGAQRKNLEAANAKQLVIERDIKIGLKYDCDGYIYLFLRGSVIQGYSDYLFRNIETYLRYKDIPGVSSPPIGVKVANYQLEAGIFKFHFTGSIPTYSELNTKNNVIFVKYTDQIKKYTCKYLGGDASRFNQ